MILASWLVVLLAACGQETAPPSVDAASQPLVQRAISPRNMDASTLSEWLTQPSERPRVVNFWATWCEPCLAEMPVLKELARRHADVDFVFVNVDAASVQGARVGQLRRTLGLDHLPAILLEAADPNAELRHHIAGWPEQIPWTLVVARDGTIVARFLEGVHGPEVEAAIATASARPGGAG